MQVFKFGNASLQSVEHIRHVANIVTTYHHETPLIIVTSAIGKTTNTLEKVVENFTQHQPKEALRLFAEIKKQHVDIAKYLLVFNFNECLERMVDYFTEVEWLLHDTPTQSNDYYYDQIVCIGELLSSTILSAYLSEIKLKSTFIDIRDVIKTNQQFKSAKVHIAASTEKAIANMLPLIKENNIVITQGFIGCTDENESTTLGRKGSDYTAALLANFLDAESVTIWKEVAGIMNANPAIFQDAQPLQQLSYGEAIEMAYYDAQVIHPKTIQPLQNKNIPLLVKCFLDSEMTGTVINNTPVKNLPTIVMLKDKQILITVTTTDFSFITEGTIRAILDLFDSNAVRINLLQIEAISAQICIDDQPDAVALVAEKMSHFLDVHIESNLQLITLRHYNDTTKSKYIGNRAILLMQQTPNTLQVLVR